MRRPTDRGQASVELALALPLVCLLVFAVVQVVVVGRDHLAVQLAAREAAAAAARSSAPAAAAAEAAHGAISLRPLDVTVTEHGDRVTATVRYVEPTDVPLIGPMLPGVAISASVTMRLEPP